MDLSDPVARPMRLSPAGKRDVRTQFGALPYRVRNGKLQILLITTRRTRRWVIPKGWPQDGATPSDSAGTEAFEEAGVEGVASPQCLGIFTYIKEMDGDDLPCVVAVFPLKVKKVLKDWPEKAARSRRWESPKKAARLVQEPELARMLATFDPKALKI
ncbi:NUDIX hydrolase [Palleronia pelagia]|uniref:NUDIX domain-containing protein n=1 Tax=Palleronia pelagia TaxID=387096 RepID=A0A1H8IGH5_9RHOB|nr:NUDIX hydrolase [Palleronia pelagia]SEN67382.1 NUDIX domain-containing protein [Palleronia pelagia]